MGIEDEWLEKFNRAQRARLLSVFTSSCRRNKHGTARFPVLKGGTVKDALTHVRSSFRTNLRADPALDADGQTSLFLTRQLRGYVDADPAKKQQKCLPLSDFRKLYKDRFTPLHAAMGQLACGAFFFGMRSCEYLTVTGKKRKTKRLRIMNIRFFKNQQEIKNKRSALTKYADTVSITFEFQKNSQKNITVTQPRSDKDICPVISWSEITQQVLSYDATN